MADEHIEAQALYSLGATTALMNDYRNAISYYLDHLKIAQDWFLSVIDVVSKITHDFIVRCH